MIWSMNGPRSLSSAVQRLWKRSKLRRGQLLSGMPLFPESAWNIGTCTNVVLFGLDRPAPKSNCRMDELS